MGDLGAASVEPTHSQTQIWLGQRLNPGSPLYNMAFAFVFPAELETELFCEAWRLVVERSDALRTRLVEPEGGGVRIQLAEHATPTEVLDFTSRSEPLDEFKSWCHQRCAKALSLEGALIDSVLVRLGEGRTGWYLNQHHLITDAWSTQLLFREVGAEYQSLSGGDVAAERASLADYYPTAESLQRGSAETRSEAEEHWAARSERAGRSVSFYGRDGRPVGTVSRRLSLELGEGRSRALDRLCEQDGFSSLSPEISRFALFATLLVSWLHRISGWQELSFDAPIAGRPTPDAKRSLGLFIELFPFAARVESGDTFRSLGARCLEEARRFLGHGPYPGPSAPLPAPRPSNVSSSTTFQPAFGDFAGLSGRGSTGCTPGHGDSLHALRAPGARFLRATGRYTLHFDGQREGAAGAALRRPRLSSHFERLLAASAWRTRIGLIAEADLRGAEERQLARRAQRHRLAAAARTIGGRDDSRPMAGVATPASRGAAPGRASRPPTPSLPRPDPGSISPRPSSQDGLEPGRPGRHLARSQVDSLAVVAVLATMRARSRLRAHRSGQHPAGAAGPGPPRETPARASCSSAISEAVEPVSDSRGERDQLSVAEAHPHRRARGHPSTAHAPAPDESRLPHLHLGLDRSSRRASSIEHWRPRPTISGLGRPDQYVRGDRLTFPLFTSLAFDLTLTSLFLPLITGGTPRDLPGAPKDRWTPP